MGEEPQRVDGLGGAPELEACLARHCAAHLRASPASAGLRRVTSRAWGRRETAVQGRRGDPAARVLAGGIGRRGGRGRREEAGRRWPASP